MTKIRKAISRIPLIGYLLRLGSSIIFLPRRQVNSNHAIHNLFQRADALKSELINTNEQVIDLLYQKEKILDEIKNVQEEVSNIRAEKFKIQSSLKTNSNKNAVSANSSSFADNHLLDDFYIKFENKFRGDEKTIIDRLQVYVPYIKKLNTDLYDLPLIDIGCGRGEFLEVINQSNLPIKVIGVDLNGDMVKRARKKGFQVEEQDALEYIASRKNNSLSGICGFHIVEHIPFAELLKLFTDSYLALHKGGVVIFETPNPENLTVGSLNFHYDPSHLKPLPPQLLAFCLEYAGFKEVQILPLHPEIEKIETKDDLTRQSIEKLFGPRDYAVIAYK